MKRAYRDLDKARQDAPGEYSNIIDTTVADEDDAEQRKTSITERLDSLEESLMSTKSKMDKAHNKLTTMNQTFDAFMSWLEDTEHKLREVLPTQVTLQNFEQVAGHYNVRICNVHFYCMYSLCVVCVVCVCVYSMCVYVCMCVCVCVHVVAIA